MSDSIIYGARCVIDGTWYIGKTDRTLEQRVAEHERAASTNAPDLFHKTMRDMGLRNFEWKELDRCSKDEVFERERKWIEILGGQSIDLLNTTHAPKSKKAAGVIVPDKIKSKIAGSQTWKKQSSKMWLQRSWKLFPVINLTTSERFQSLMDAARKSPDNRPGIKSSCETGRPTLTGNRYAYLDLDGSPILKEGHTKTLQRTRRVKNLTTGATYESLAHAAKSTKASQNIIQGCCTGKYKTASGLVFAYIDDQDQEILTETHRRYQAEIEQSKNFGLGAWRIEDTDRKAIVYADTVTELASILEIDVNHIFAICRGERQHTHGWRVAFYDKLSKQLDLRPSHFAKIKKRIRRVMCLNDQTIFGSLSDAAIHYGLESQQIRLCCDGILKTTGRYKTKGQGYRFAYVDERNRPFLTPKHDEPLETLGDIRLFCPQTGQTYQSIAHCSRETGVPQKRIRRYLKDNTVDLAGITLIELQPQ